MDYKQNVQLFYTADLQKDTSVVKLSEQETYHATKVLRYLKGDEITVTNGKGLLAVCIINDIVQKQAELKIIKTSQARQMNNNIHLAISPVKNREKNEWMVEKATEIGVSEISFFISEHSERTVINMERLEKITISAIKQSLNPFKPVLNPIDKFEIFLKKFEKNPCHKFIAYCKTTTEQFFLKYLNKSSDVIVMVGPEGDFTTEEINLARNFGFIPINLGENRLRSETATVYALSAIKSFQHVEVS